MRYLAKGIVAEQSTEHILHINHFGSEFVLTGEKAALWLDARLRIAETKPNDYIEEKAVRCLQQQDLVEILEPDDVGVYRALTNCIIVPAEAHSLFCPLSRDEKTLLRWITGAGLRLTMAELVFLTDHKMEPKEQWLGPENRQQLTEAIYTADNIFDRTLETQMESADSRNRTVQTVLSLLAKKRILLL